jgi:hypothetical protein
LASLEVEGSSMTQISTHDVPPRRWQIGWLEALLLLSLLSLVLQLFPGLEQLLLRLLRYLLSWLDPRAWSRPWLFVTNALVIVGLFVYRGREAIYESIAARRTAKVEKRAAAEKLQKIREARQRKEEIERSRRRRIW